MKKLFILGLALLAACVANAIPTLTGPTGGLELPTANVATGVTVSMNLDVAGDSPAYPSSGVLFGVCKGLEVGGQFGQVNAGDGRESTWNVNGKYQLPINAGAAKIAIGAGFGQDIFDHLWNVYLAGTTPMWGTTATANIGYSKDATQGWNGISAGLAMEKSLNETTSVGAEFLFGDKAGIFTAVAPFEVHGNLYLTRMLTSQFSATVGLGGFGQGTDLYVAGAYKFGK